MEMTNFNVLFALLIIAPVVFGILAYIAPLDKLRTVSIVLCSVVVAAAGVLITLEPSQQLTLKFPGAEMVAAALEIAIVGVILYISLKIKNWMIMLMCLAQLGMIIAGMIMAHAGLAVSQAHDFATDPLTKILILITSLVGPVIAIYAIGYMKSHQEHAPPAAASLGQFFFFFIAFLGFMNGLVMANNLKWFSFFWEATTLCSYMLIGQDGGESKKNAERALLINTFGGLAMVAGALWLTVVNKTESFDGLLAARAVIPMALLCVAAFTKSALLPFQSWLLGAMIAPTPVSALLHSATMVKAGSYLTLRITPGFYDSPRVMMVIAFTGALTFAGAALLAVTQSNAKKVLAYSTISNLGLVVACAGINSPLAYAAALAIICFHAISKGLLFLCVGRIEQKIGSRDIEDMGGILFRMPITTSVTLIGMMSMLLPPFGMLLSKWMAIEATIRSPLILIFIILGSALTVFFWCKWIGRIQTSSYHPKFNKESVDPAMGFALITLALGVLLTGVGSIWIFNRFFSPITKSVFAGRSDIPELLWKVFDAAGNFAAVTLFIAVGVAFLAYWLLVWRRFRETDVRLPYLCGENAESSVYKTSAFNNSEGARSYAFRSMGDKIEDAWASTTYLKNFISEKKATVWLNLAAWAIIIILLGEAHLL